MLNKNKKQDLIKKFQTHAGDTGSSEVQIAILTAEIDELIGHLKNHPKDHSSRRGLLRKVSSRRHLLRYLLSENPESHEKLTKKLKIKQPRAAVKAVEPAEEELEELEKDTELNEKENETAVE